MNVPSAGRRCESSRAQKKLAITVFSSPTGNVGTVAYLDVFGSIHRVMEEMKAKG